MTTPLLPQAFWFRLAMPCVRVDALPRASGRPLDLPVACRLPEFARLEGQTPWADVRAAWNPKGLGVAVEVARSAGPAGRWADAVNGLELWVDTRDTRDVHRATRFCHHFAAYLPPASKGPIAEPVVAQQPIARALANAPSAAPKAIRAWAERLRAGGWRLEIFLSADALHGFDPDTNRRLGLYYQVIDAGLGDQFLGVGREFPVGEDPSLWATLELRDGA